MTMTMTMTMMVAVAVGVVEAVGVAVAKVLNIVPLVYDNETYLFIRDRKQRRRTKNKKKLL